MNAEENNKKIRESKQEKMAGPEQNT